MKISLVINVDTRPQNDVFGGTNLMGVVNEDFLTEGVKNKIKFFDGFDIEVIVYVDEHLHLSTTMAGFIRSLCDLIVVRKHTNEPSFNCYNYLRGLQMASGDIICHVDQDTACFTTSPEPIHNLIKLLDEHAFVSYPSYWSPKPVHDESFGNRTWASTRFFLCKRETLQFDILRACIDEPEWAYGIFGDSPRRCNWLEHFLTLTNNDDCFYPPLDTYNYMVFCWDKYVQGTLEKLNNSTYEEVCDFVNQCGGIHYPVDVTCA